MTSLITRKRLSDITNLTSIRRSPRSKAEDQEMVKAVPTVSAKNYISQLLTENSALSKIIEEKNKIIDMNGIELRKLRFMLQKAHQQNAQFAHTNSQMLAEFNLGKDRLKAMQHELGCMTAALRTKTLELEEVKKLYKQHKQPYKNINIVFKENKNKLAEFVPDASHLASYQKACSPNGKRKLRSRSLGTTILPQQVAAKEKNECRNSRSLRRRSSNLNAEHCEPTEGLFEIEDIKFPIRSLTSDPMHEDNSAQLEPSSAQPKSDAIMNPVKVEIQEEKSSSKDHQGSRRSSLGRPMRRAAEKVNSYKEVPLNVKMRRNE